MEPLKLKQREPVEEPEVEDWDDGDFDGLDDIHFRNASTATSVVSTAPAQTRDSLSRMSIRSDSNQGDENWDVVVDEQAPIKDAVALARSKGIPLPANVPRSALEGGTIRRLNGKAIKQAIADDWSEDLDIPSADGPLKLAKHESLDFNESLRQLSAAFRSSPKSPEADLDKTLKSPKSRTAATPISLDAYRDDDEDDDLGEVPTIRVSKQRSPGKPTLIKPPTTKTPDIPENIEEGLELPSNGELRLSTRKTQPKTPQTGEEFDFEWGEGSLGTRNAGRGRAGRSARSSSASALSPSVSSAFTAESEDEGLDGLILPDGPIPFQKKLEQRQADQERDLESSPMKERPKSVPQPPPDDSFFDDLDVGDGDVFTSTKLKNKNVKTKNQRSTSPSKRTTTTLNFTTSKNQASSSRLPRFQTSHERAKSNLEPVSESGGPPTRFQRPGSRLGLHSAQSSVSAIPAPSTPTPSTPSRRTLRNADPRIDNHRDAPTTTSAQLLRAKRSMPVIRGLTSPTKSDRYIRPPSRAEAGSRLQIYYDRPESRGENKKQPVFLPAGASHGQSQHASLKLGFSKGHIRRADSDGSGDTMSAAQRSLTRIVALGRPETPGRNRTAGMSAAELAAQAKKQVTKPSRRRNYGDGNELDIFDDLPTSASLESKFVKLPIGRGAPRSLRSKFGLGIQSNHSTSTITSLRTTIDTSMPQTPLSPPRQDFPTTATSMATVNVPRFARDTAASRNAREQRTISNTFQNIHGEPLKPISANFQLGAHPHTSLQRPHTSGTGTYGSLRKKKTVQQKPHLIKPMGPDVHREKSEKGMRYNPVLYRWEGNENALAPFDIPPPDFHARSGSPIALGAFDKDRKAQGSPVAGGNKANVALISNIGNVAGVQVVGGMVFDPSQMRWLKVKEDGPRNRGGSLGAQSVEVEEEEDVFAGLEDLKEEGSEWDLKSQSHRGSAAGVTPQEYGIGMVPAGATHTPTALRRKVSNESAGSNSDDETGLDGPTIAEEFDVGPEFVKRQRAEEERWRRKVEKWMRTPEEAAREHQDGGWLWDVRRLVA